MTIIGFPAVPPYMDINDPQDQKIEEDKINPAHYKQYGVECIEITENMGFLDGNIFKYMYRWRMKGWIDDLDKADWYLQRLRAKVRGTNNAGC